ncbi:hypothetical protein [Jannaschia seohaensis]|uniref:Uncharacterized protein n=1 Tax=Jannaschia seohaensis TaxID=475081 RepID=A0A2Y9A2W7_9RHOB|nr:hypothetical protein [Jannaschia seohaensis]PWJ22523.1 hypothetical protein BCF38_101937 [Jannaschia seohaensis]SSA38801.1 hypothetical protein SAMN05421539_101937 [Jannaschia seohaensis]
MTALTPEAVEALFTRSDDSFLFARWGRPIAPVLFGVEDSTISVFKGALEALCVLTGHNLAELDPEFGVNLMVFFIRDWSELKETPNLDRLIPDLGPLVARLEAADANQYRLFRFDANGAIQACFAFIRVDAEVAAVPAETLALNQMVQALLLWSDRAFTDSSPLALVEDRAVLRPDIADLMRAAYDPAIPAMSQDPSTALRLAARLGRGQ